MNRLPAFLTSKPLLMGIRVLVGGLFVYAGLAKLMDAHAFLKAIDSFHILPPSFVGLWAIILPPLEIVAGAAFVIGRWPRAGGAIILGLCGLFLGALGLGLLRGIPAECGCFAGLGASSTSLGTALIRDVLLIAATAWWLMSDRGRAEYEPEACLFPL